MKKFLKISGIVLLVILLILIITPFFLKKPIEKIAKEELNKSLNAKIDFSDVKLSLIRNFPNVYIGLENFTIVGIGEFEKDTLLSFKTFSVSVDLISAIKMTNIKVKSILLDEPRVSAHVLKNGKVNWDIVKPSEPTPADTTPSAEFNFGANLKKFEIAHGYIKYQDDTANMSASISDLNFVLKGDFSAKQCDMQINTTIEALDFIMGNIHYLKKAKIGFDAKIGANLEKAIYTFKENEIRLNELSLGFEGMVQMPGDSIVTDIKFKTKKADFKTLLSLVPAVYMKDFPSIQTAGVLKLDGYVKGIYYGNKLPNVGLTLLVEKAMFRYPSLPRSVENINIDVDLFYDGSQMDNTTVDVNKFHFETAENPFNMELHVKTPISDMAVDGNFTGKIDFSSLKDVIHLDSTTLKGIVESNVDFKGTMSMIEQNKYEDFKANGVIKLTDFEYASPLFPQGIKILTATMEFSPKYVALSQFDSRIGKSDFKLEGKLEKFIPYVFNKGTLNGSLSLNSNLIDVSEFLPQEEGKVQTEDTTSLTLFEVPERIDFTMNSNIGQLNYDKLKITDIAGIIIVRDRKAILQNLGMNLLEGSMKMSGEYNTQDIKNPSFDFNFNMSNIDIPSAYTAFNTVAKLAPVAQNCKGKISADISLTSYLDPHMMPIYSSMTGKGELKSNAIEIGNSNTFIKIADALKNDKFRKLSLSDVDVKFSIKNGRVYIDPFETKMGTSKMIIGGDQGIDQTLNYLVKLVIPRADLGSAANKVVEGLTSNAVAKGLNIKAGETVNIDASVLGTVLKPEVKLNLANNAKSGIQDMKAQLKETVSTKVADVKKEVSAKAKAEADKIIKEAEVKAQQLKDAAAVAAEKTRTEANALATKTENSSSNPLLKAAAKKTAEKIRKEGDSKANKIVQKANAQSDSIINTAKAKAAKL
jgi:hypothetical protein